MYIGRVTSPANVPLTMQFHTHTTPPPTPATRSSSAFQIAYHQSCHEVTLAHEIPKIVEVPPHLQDAVKENIHRVSIGEVADTLQTNLEVGLSSAEAQRRLAVRIHHL